MTCEDISVIVEAAVQRIKREISEEKKKILESNYVKRHLRDSELDFEVKDLVWKLSSMCFFPVCSSSSDLQQQSRETKKSAGLGQRPVSGANTSRKRQRLCRTKPNSLVSASRPPGMYRTTAPVWLQNPSEGDRAWERGWAGGETTKEHLQGCNQFPSLLF